ncbi:MAG: hypothetical protein V9G04_14105 [Nocardioides sp.]|jgi:hypothetical protein
MPTVSDGLREPKKLMWGRFYVCAVVPRELAVPALTWLWENHQPAKRQRMIVTGATISETAEDALVELELGMEYVARGANSHDVRRKVWQALTVVSGTKNLMARVEAKQIAQVWLDFREYRHKDPQWLEDKAFAAGAVADEVLGRDDWLADDFDDNGGDDQMPSEPA